MKNNISARNKNLLCCVVIVILILVGLFFFVKKNNLLNLGNNVQEGFSSTNSRPMGLNNITKRPNPDENTVVLVLFYVDWCPHCVSTKPEWEKLVNEVNNTKINNKNVEVVAANCEGTEVEKNLAEDNNVEGFPTIKLIKNDNIVDTMVERCRKHEKFIENTE